MALWRGLLAASNLQLHNPNFYGDSKLVIGWIFGTGINGLETENTSIMADFELPSY